MEPRIRRTDTTSGHIRPHQLRRHDEAYARVDRRSVLKFIGVATFGLLAGLPGHRLLAADNPLAQTAIPPHFTDYLLPYPGKRALLAASQSDIGAALQAATLRFPRPATDDTDITQLAWWTVNSYPNYTDSAVVGQNHFVWVACYGSNNDNRTITQINVQTNSTVSLPTGTDTRPLDVAYDEKRGRIVVASADDAATMVVLDSQGNTVTRRKLAQDTGQGLSDGGAQGVAVDANGDYWFTLAYYHPTAPRGVVVKMDGQSLETAIQIQNAGLDNPNGIIFVESGPYILVFSDNGYAHQFGLDGKLQRVLSTIDVGYRGAVSGNYLWVGAWLEEGKMARVDLRTGSRQIFPCAPLANSVAVDDLGRVWVAGDAGVSASDQSGALLAMSSLPAYSNGLTSLGGRMHLTSSLDERMHVTPRQDRLNQVAMISPRIRLPSVLLSQQTPD